MFIDQGARDDDHSPAAYYPRTGGGDVAPECPRSQLGTLLTGAEAATVPRVYVVNAQADQSLANEVSFRLIDWGMVLNGTGLLPRGSPGGAAMATDRLRTASVVVVLLTSKAVTDTTVQHDAATAVAQARLDPSKVIVPVLLDPGADPDATFAGHTWLVPSSNRADDVARAVFQAVHLAPDLVPTESRAPTASVPELEAASVAEVRAAIAGTQARRRAVLTAVGILVLVNIALVTLAVATHGDDMSQLLLTIVSPLITFLGVVLGFSLGRRDLAYRRSRDRR